jgi:hypothetical protein|tara:strand:+ start:3120 stop:3785 length:666 start_codon:yes stop_codon:yes gene_type:complete
MAISFDKLNGGAVKSEVKYMKLVTGTNTFRILPDSILPAYTYWVKGASGKDLPFEALQFNRSTEKFDNKIPCPVRDKGIKDAKGEDINCQWAYKCQVVNKATGAIEILQLKKGILNDIISVAKQVGFDPTDLDTGTWVTVTRKSTGPKAFNVEYTLHQLQCKSAPLEDEFLEKIQGLKSIEELFPKETYESQTERLDKHINGEKKEAEVNSSDQEAIDELG